LRLMVTHKSTSLFITTPDISQDKLTRVDRL
jgi:hypothetical protein